MKEASDNQELPAKFEDSKGREWHVQLDFIVLREIKRVVAIDIGDLQQIGRTWAELVFDDLKAIDTVWIAIGGNAGSEAASGPLHDGAVITKDDWLSAMNGPLLENARIALKEAIENFTPPLKRNILQQGMAAIDKTYRLMIADTETKVKKATSKAVAQAVRSARHGKLPPAAPA